MPVSNTYVEPTSGTTLNLARQQFNNSMRAVLTNFKGPTIPTNLIADETLFTTQQDGMLYRSSTTNALYILDTANKQSGNIGGGFTRWGIGPRVESTVASLTTRAALANFYETGETVVTLDTGRLYVKTGTTNAFASFTDVGNPVGYTIGTSSNVTFTGDSVTATQFLATTNIGINKSAPTVALDVVGSATISGTAQANLVSAASYQTFTTAYSATSWTTAGPAFNTRTRSYTDTSSAANTIINPRTSFSILIPTFQASNSNVNITNGSTLYIGGAPASASNTVITNPHAVHILNGRVYNQGAGSNTIPAYAVRSVNIGIFSPTTTSLGISVLGNTAATFDNFGTATVTEVAITAAGGIGNPTLSIGSSTVNGFYASNTTTINVTGNFIAGGDISAFSDERLKSNIRTIDNAMAKVTQLRGVYFNKDNKPSIGVIAQEIEKILPEVVTDGDYKSVSYGNIVGILIEAIKDLEVRIIELEKRLV